MDPTLRPYNCVSTIADRPVGGLRAVKAKPNSALRARRPYMMAVVLGTALSALGATRAEAAPILGVNEQTITDISRYCSACWRNARLHPSCWDDCTQEVFHRLLQRVAPQTWHDIITS